MIASKSKYRNQRAIVDGIVFDSKLEARHYGHLKMLLLAGHIKSFDRQVSYPILLNGHKICSYIADFVVDHPNGTKEVQDCKGVKTPVYQIKKKLLLAAHGFQITEITA